MAAESDLGPGLIGITYAQPPPTLTDPNSELRLALDEEEGRAWDDQLNRCRAEARRARTEQSDIAELSSAEIADEAEKNMEARLGVERGVVEARNQFFGCLAESGFGVPHGVAQRVLVQFVEDRYESLLEKFWFGDPPWPEADLGDC